ncbi:C-type lectin domain family 12 member B-like [Mercenaria mercenaria]|uniref:C-type lectin domain family 12 member B-like n=1 Tax=Mercenaria mercenaria TaxID=6596 RepID=UPI00234F2FAE|nr:C-type lectin domain family 12 member B-like [Mercenaria mercenaria]
MGTFWFLGASAHCVDADSDCATYSREYICTGDNIPWSTIHCRKYCNLCLLATKESTTVTTELTTKSFTTETTASTPATITHLPRTSATVIATTATVISMCPKEVEQRAQSQYVFQLGEKCYEFVPLNDSWMYAKEDCHNKSGHLLSIISADEQTFISNMLTTINFTQQLWLGLDDRINEEQWEWNSGTNR